MSPAASRIRERSNPDSTTRLCTDLGMYLFGRVGHRVGGRGGRRAGAGARPSIDHPIDGPTDAAPGLR